MLYYRCFLFLYLHLIINLVTGKSLHGLEHMAKFKNRFKEILTSFLLLSHLLLLSSRSRMIFNVTMHLSSTSSSKFLSVMLPVFIVYNNYSLMRINSIQKTKCHAKWRQNFLLPKRHSTCQKFVVSYLTLALIILNNTI